MKMKDDADEQGEERLGDLRAILSFLAATPEVKTSYLPCPRFRSTRFHISTGDFETSYPLEFLARVGSDCFWSAAPDDLTDAQFASLRKLDSLLTLMTLTTDKRVWDSRCCFDIDPFRGIWEVAAELAQAGLVSFGWSLQTFQLPCRQLLDEYSYGAFSELNPATA